MFNNPLRKYQQGGTAPTQEQQKLLAAFIEWLPKRVKEFQGMQPEAIAKALDGMSKTPEGQKQVQQLMEQFQQEMQQNEQQAFRNGGKIHDFICKHAKGGMVDCGCGGIKVAMAQEGSGDAFDSSIKQYNENGILLDNADLAAIERRKQPRTITYVQNRTPWNRNWNNFDGYWTKKTMLPEHNVVIGREALGINPLNGRYETMGFTPSGEEFKYQEGGEIQYSESTERPNIILTRRQARELSNQNKGFNRSQFQIAMANADNMLRNAGLRGRELRNQKRILVSGITGQDKNLVEQPIKVTLESNEPVALNSPTELTGVPERVTVRKQVVSEPIATRADYPLQVNIPTVSGSLPENIGRRSQNRTQQAQSNRNRNMGRVEQYIRLTGADDAVSEWNSDQLARDYAQKHGIALTEVPIDRESEEYAEGVRQANREAAITTGVGIVAAPAAAWLATSGIPAAFNAGRTALTRAFGNSVSKVTHPLAEDVMRGLNFGRGPIVDGRSIYYVAGPGSFFKQGGKVEKTQEITKFKNILHK